MGLLDKFKGVLGLGDKEEEKKEIKKDKPKKKKKLTKVEKIRKIENIHKPKVKVTPPSLLQNNSDTAANRKKHRRSLLDEAKNGQN